MERIDLVMVEKGLAESRSQAQRLVMAGQVRVNDQLIHKPSKKISPKDRISVEGGPAFVSRGGDKLQAAIDKFELGIQDRVCADVGSSTGGFSDCLLQNGAAKVYAIDVGRGQLHWKLRRDARIILMEETNARYIKALPETVDIIVVDVSFISLNIILPVVANWLSEQGHIVVLIKPQFEAGREHIGKGGVVRDPMVHRDVVAAVLALGPDLGLHTSGLIRSPLQGPKGNIEFLAWFSRQGPERKPDRLLADIFNA
ncbi:MAG: TlyA family RNA methyltransferase [Anaerolineales bacterium]|jgi:23S rRNA (cytidine1920-2'-O)/16S rRNA (cytidine1409-2'-O)-methyltransferase